MTTPDEDTVAQLVAAALAELESGRPVDLDALCHEHAHCRAAVAEALELQGALADMHRRRAAPEPGTRLLAGRYRLLETIGAGAAGTVFRARDQQLERDVAVKLLHRDTFAGGDGEARFRREALVLAAHEHPHIVRVHDHGRTDDTTFLVTELLRGRSLQTILAERTQPRPAGPSGAAGTELDWLRRLLPTAQLETNWLRQAVRWTAELGRGLQAAHRNGICHRDIKPSNAFVREDGSAVLLDFGIAARIGEASITRTHAVLGTPCYMAPEQAGGANEPHPTLDVYGLAATLYHLLTLRPPHEGDLQQVMLALRYEDPMPATRLVRGLPRDLGAILDRGLARHRSHRYQDIAALVADLDAFLHHQPVAARPLGPLVRRWRRMRQRPARSLAIAAGTLALVATAFVLPLWSTVRAAGAARERHERLARLPADLCIEGRPEQRALVPLDERNGLLGELDALLALDADDLGIRLLRASTWLDAGEVDRASADFAAIAAIAASPYTAALAGRHADAVHSDRRGGAIDLAGLPEPEDAVDCFLAGFFALRQRDCARADELLTRAADYLPARDLRLLAILGKHPTEPQRAIAEANWLEGAYGRETARTQHTIAAGLLQQRQYALAIPHCERALALRPDRHGPWNNLGLAHLRLGHLDEAQRCLERAVELRPWFDNSLSNLCQTYRRQARWAPARDVAERIGDRGLREYELGNVAMEQAFVALLANDREARIAHAASAAQHYGLAAAAEGTDNPKASSVPAAQLLATSLADDDLARALPPFLLAMRGDPRNPRQIANLAALLGEVPLDDDSLGRLRLWLLDLAIDLNPDDPELRRLRTRFLQQLTRR